MRIGHKRDAVLNDKFYFRKNVFTGNASKEGEDEDEYELMTINEIINGKVNFFFF
jgi:glutamate--cysteine ligase catalytic subunit